MKPSSSSPSISAPHGHLAPPSVPTVGRGSHHGRLRATASASGPDLRGAVGDPFGERLGARRRRQVGTGGEIDGLEHRVHGAPDRGAGAAAPPRRRGVGRGLLGEAGIVGCCRIGRGRDRRRRDAQRARRGCQDEVACLAPVLEA